MTNEEKDLLIKDLCGRLPYEVKISTRPQGNFNFRDSELCGELLDNFIKRDWGIIKPYLRPIESMTNEEEIEWFEDVVPTLNPDKQIDFYNKYHFDYRGLIEKGLALEAPQDMYNKMEE